MDYNELGLKAGLEIHQQVDTNKLFCGCKSEIQDKEPDFVTSRRLRVSAGETGEVDITALHEVRKDKFYVYNGYRKSSCLVELDEEPIHELEKNALNISLQVAKLLKADIIDRIQVMRKTVVDGSNTSGFQRTALIGRNGEIETSEGKVSIPTVCLEEDSAKIVQKTPQFDVYNLSRLGIPLIEISTGPDLKSPEHVKETAEQLGMILRSTGKVKRGLGTIRQDVNVSIKGGTRVEIKGAQDLRSLGKIVSLEVERQKNLLDISRKLKGKVSKDIVDVTSIFKNSESKIVIGNFVLGVKLDGFKGFLGKEVQPRRRLGTELSDYAKIATGVLGILHSDELPKYGITQEEVDSVTKKLKLGSNDAFVIVAADKKRAETALHAAIGRAEFAMKGIPGEVRKTNADGTTSYMRQMPGAARMYPETDTYAISPELDKIKLPELRSIKVDRYLKLGLGTDLAKTVIKTEKDELFERITSNSKQSPSFIAETLVSYYRELLKMHLDPFKVKDTHLELIFSTLDEEKIAKESVPSILADIGKTGILDLTKYSVLSDKELESELRKIVAENKKTPFNALIGKAMANLRGKAEGRKIADILKKLSK